MLGDDFNAGIAGCADPAGTAATATELVSPSRSTAPGVPCLDTLELGGGGLKNGNPAPGVARGGGSMIGPIGDTGAGHLLPLSAEASLTSE
jgi:hypothetical protein